MSSPDPTMKDLDALLAPRKQAKLGGHMFLLPGDLPLEIHLRIQQGLSDDDDTRGTNTIRDAFVDLLCFLDPDRMGDAAEVTRPLGLRTILRLTNAIYEDADDIEAEAAGAAADPTASSPTTAAAIPTTTGISSSDSSPTPNSETSEPEAQTASAG